MALIRQNLTGVLAGIRAGGHNEVAACLETLPEHEACIVEVVRAWVAGKAITLPARRAVHGLVFRATANPRTRRRYQRALGSKPEAQSSLDAIRRQIGLTRPRDADSIAALCTSLADIACTASTIVDLLQALEIEPEGVDRTAAIQRVSLRVKRQRQRVGT